MHAISFDYTLDASSAMVCQHDLSRTCIPDYSLSQAGKLTAAHKTRARNWHQILTL